MHRILKIAAADLLLIPAAWLAYFAWDTLRCIPINNLEDARYTVERYLHRHTDSCSEDYRIIDLKSQITGFEFTPAVMANEAGLRHVRFTFDTGCGVTFQTMATLDLCGHVWRPGWEEACVPDNVSADEESKG